ncbi:hypothetical protein NMY22_g15284 [Coprinellus aureogranulatus]|nr:hypothetical protein NMY22_g15284 [Coprinellus aureogranulatus]
MYYRCFTIRYSDPLWLRISPMLLFIPTIVFGILTVNEYTKPNQAIIAWPQPTFISFTVAFNILVTVLIAHRLIRSRQELKGVLPGRDMRVYTGATAILIESALPLSLTGIGYAILAGLSIKGDGNPFVGMTFLNLFNLLYTSFNQLSPTLIIFRVTTGRSWTSDFNETIMTTSSGEKRHGTLNFRHTNRDEQEELSSSNGAHEPSTEDKGLPGKLEDEKV